MPRLHIVIKKAIVLFFPSLIVGISIAYAQLPVEMLLVGGGGGGGRNDGSNSSGGGGASGGQVVHATASFAAADVFTIVVAGGGLGYRNSPLVNQTNGNPSSITGTPGTWSALGGNAGGNATSASSSGAGGVSVNTDGSGAGGRGGIIVNGNTPSGWPVSGGNGTSTYTAWGAATSTGQMVSGVFYYAGGGSGGNWGGQSGAGVGVAGFGGGGTANADASPNTGGGGGGANSNGSSGFALPGGNGGSGIIIIRYAGNPVATGGAIVTTGGFTYHTFTSNGTLTVNTSLPVNWVSFTAKKVPAGVQLNWVVSSETNNLRYDIQRSADGTAFNTIASLPSQDENSITSQSYTYTDANPFSGFSFYRIRQVDIDGRYSYSIIVPVGENSAAGIIVGPNPITNNIQITLPAAMSAMYECRIFNTAGAVLTEKRIGQGTSSIYLNAAPGGIYILTLWQNGHCIYVKELLK